MELYNSLAHLAKMEKFNVGRRHWTYPIVGEPDEYFLRRQAQDK
jgi:hypothetical protein